MNRRRLLARLALGFAVAACASQNPAEPGGSGGASGSGGSAPNNTGGRAGESEAGSTTGGSAGSPLGGGAGTAGGALPVAGASAGGGGGSGGAASGAGKGTGGTNAAGTSAGGAGAQSGAAGDAGAGGSGTAGGGAAAAAGTGPSPALPVFVTSAPNDYWNTEGAVTEPATGTADLTVDPNTRFQTFTGFGGCFNEMGWDALSVLTPDEVTRALELLFDANDGANFVYGRLPMGASDYSMSWYTLDDTAGDFTMTDFSIERDREKLIPFIKAALDIRPDLQLWASPWVVPSWMMSGSNMKTDAQTLGAHALYMARFVQEYAKEGLDIVAVHPQNEPGYARVRWTQSLFIDFIKNYLGPTFAQENLTTEIWCGTMSKDPDDTNIAKAAANDPEAMEYVKGFGVQWNLQAAVATLGATAPVMQTEHKCGNYNFSTPYWDQSRYDPNKPQNDHLYGEESWQLIRDWIVAGVNSYSAWNMVLDTVGKSLDNWPQNALLTVDRTAKKLIVTPAYYAFRHFSQYVQPNAARIGLTGGTDAVAFENPDGSIIVEVYNKGDASKSTTVSAGAGLYQFEVPAHGWATLRVAQ
jgi:glucosylceramidase